MPFVRTSSKCIGLDGRIHVGRFDYSPGGVGRNICEALGKLGFPAYFVSAIGDDYQGEILLKQIPNLSRHSVAKLAGYNTAQCIVVLDSIGECSFLMGDMTIHKEISSKMVEKHEELIKAAPLVVMDGNLSIEAMDKLLGITEKHNIPVVFEPTDIATACKPFTTTKWKSINYITPNLAELKAISRYLNFPTEFLPANQIEDAAFLAQLLARHINNVVVTMGPEGILIAHKESDGKISLRHYPAQKLDNIVNVSGAGDCFASGYIAAVLTSCKESVCVSVGFAAALEALQSQSPVPKRFFDKTHPAWQIEAPHVNLQLRNDKYFFNGV